MVISCVFVGGGECRRCSYMKREERRSRQNILLLWLCRSDGLGVKSLGMLFEN